MTKYTLKTWEKRQESAGVFMNIGMAGAGFHAPGNYQSKSVFAGNLPGLHNSMLKSTQDKMERQQKAGNQIAFWENQKEKLKEMECGTVEEIARKLEMFHNYEDEIAAVKAAYNNEQMAHILDEAQEQGEKNAEAAEKLEPKTPEERREELAEEAAGTEENEGVLEEMLEEVTDSMEEVLEETAEALEETQEQLLEEQLAAENPDGADSVSEQLDRQMEKIKEEAGALREPYAYFKEENQRKYYRGLDVRV